MGKTKVKNKQNKIFKGKKGITLIALVLTVIVLLILAGVSIATLTGQGNILENASNAKQKTQRANLIESAQVDIFSEQQKTQDGNITTEKLRDILSKYFDDVPDSDEEFEENFLDNPDYSLKSKPEYGGQDIEVADVYNGSLPEETYNPDDLTLGKLEAKNTDKYGWQVTKYDVKYKYGKTLDQESNVWRLYYQDKKYTYLTTGEVVGNYEPIKYYDNAEYKDKYSDGTKMSIEGQKLNETVSSLFTADETKANPNIRATVWLTDTSDDSEWSKYKNEDAEFCIGGPTLELLAASYNAIRNGREELTFKLGTFGYSLDVSKYTKCFKLYNNGNHHDLYCPNYDSSVWEYWIASPSNNFDYSRFTQFSLEFVHGSLIDDRYCSGAYYVHPIVCMLTSKFKNKGYEASLVNK